jgi:hypothetical protein
MTEAEAIERLMFEAEIHRSAGWDVHLAGSMMVAHKLGDSGVVTRTVERVEFSPMEDS